MHRPDTSAVVGAASRLATTPTFRLLDFEFAVEADDPALVALIERLFGHAAVPRPAPHTYTALAARNNGEQCRLFFGAEELGTPSSPSYLLTFLLWHVNRQALDDNPRFLLFHAAAATSRGSAVILPAPMESGKSTLVAGLVEAGMGYLSDEAAALDLSSGTVHPYAKPISLDQGSWEVHARLEPPVRPGEEVYVSDQWHIPPGAIRPGAVSAPAPARLIVLPRYERGAPTAVERVSRASALVELVRNAFNFSAMGPAAPVALARHLQRCECRRLTVDDLDEAVAAVFEVAESLDPDDVPAVGSEAAVEAISRGQVHAVTLDDEAVVWNESTRALHVLNQTATDVWLAMDGSRDLPEVIRRVAEAYRVPEPAIERDVTDLVATLRDQGLAPSQPTTDGCVREGTSGTTR